MFNGRNRNLKPQDVVILLKVLAQERPSWRVGDLAYEMGMSQSEVSLGLERLKFCGLIDSEKKVPLKKAAFEFLVHGLKYAFPLELGPTQRGVSTALSATELGSKFVGGNSYVWPDPNGNESGAAIAPLFDCVPFAVKNDKKLHRLLALVDVIRLGRAREVSMVQKILEKELVA